MLEEVGLFAAVEWLVKSFSKSYGVAISFSSNVEKETISFYQSLALYRVVQESLTNIMRYANAANVTVAITKVDNDIVLHIADDGNGFNVDAVDTTMHHGILGMRERVYAMNGTFSINSVLGDGTFINVHVPIVT